MKKKNKGRQYCDMVIGEMVDHIKSNGPYANIAELINDLNQLSVTLFKTNSFYKKTPKIFSGKIATLHHICCAMWLLGVNDPFHIIMDSIPLSHLAPCEWNYSDVESLNQIYFSHTERNN